MQQIFAGKLRFDFDDEWKNIMTDLEIIRTEGLKSAKQVDPRLVIKKKDGKDVEIQEGWVGHIIPFSLIQEIKLKDKLLLLKKNELRIQEISSLYEESIEELSEDEKEEISELLNDEKDSFQPTEVLKYAKKLKGQFLPNGSLDLRIFKISKAIEEEKELRKQIKVLQSDLEISTKKAIEELSDSEVLDLLKEKWINPVLASLEKLPEKLINDFSSKLQKLSKKYENTYFDLDNEILETETALSDMIDELEADEFDKKGLVELQKLLRGL